MHARVAAVTSTALLGTAAVLLAQAPDASAAARPAPVVVAHRGASARAPENTLAAVDKAAEMEVAWVENDVQRTKDGELVVIHDDTLRRTTNAAKIFPGRAPWKVKDFTAAEIAQLDAGSWFGPAFAGQRVPTLKQFVNRLDTHRQKLLLEIKNPQLYPGIEQQIIKVLGNEGWLDPWHLTSRLIVQSFDAASIRTVHGLRPAVRTGFLGTPAVADLPSYARFADLINPSHTTVTSEYVSAVHALRGPHHRRLQMYVWTVDDAVNARKAAGYGVDGIITNKPDVVRAALP
ncbi:glycerophosphodiester phosphodiesterase [Streptomyces acidiscabies]|uniref:Glycerophosphodiester phosphodiesterase family protein n=1 Tax=Streptomyces acidiscabies TaxID=42234 RepID=A0AAP6ED87_9ACTN|nr:glycerophosphodiester phosphodiesterase family protein [Streptomyces acidiscabies]MBP5940327.1 glycerophosphodiester phosphodiesterase [Streptomyces sp. LBUM 1476]MBZ3911563.1 glycerophosphodiester phosphodiesterase [Streptomyces acidiscabies]MDX2958787.1 glycerophosphodiester phosphodiesterase family protein [Streptomyces acidiscabies]MDX3018224.1 glycerophosphodiester phosphodiesterase family protein [Streptomyces acidiscabies]MDX3791622.1 glycerophosphodiester phosphodiesterase family pr